MESLRQTMSSWNLRELRAPPNLLSLLRVPMAIMVWQVVRDPVALLMLAGLAGLTDVLDGVAARSMPTRDASDTTSPAQRNMGDWLDPLCDKIFVASAIVAAAYVYRPSPQILLLILFRDVAQSLLFLLALPLLWRHRVHLNFRANRWGKTTTVLQFASLVAILFSSQWLPLLAYAAALCGLMAVGVYARRSLQKWRCARLPQQNATSATG